MPVKRRSARDLAREFERLRSRAGSTTDPLLLLHEVQVYQEELLVQNEELNLAQQQLEETRDRFIDLYEFAPNGYLTLDQHGIVVQINTTGAAMFGRSPRSIEGLPLLGFFVQASRQEFLDFLRRCRRAEVGTALEVELRIRSDGEPRDVQLLSRPRLSRHAGKREYLTAMADVSERKRLEHERELISRERESLAIRLLAAQEEERQRIARDLHDDLGQQVTALRLKLDAIAAMATGAALERTREAIGLLAGADARLHFLAADLRPASLDLGLAAALEQLLHRWSETFGIPAEITVSELKDVRLPPAVEAHIYRVAQEALNNVYKHAAAHQVSVLLQRRDGGLVLIVEDDGKGFDADGPREGRTGVGLVGMRERAHQIGGELNIESSPGHGTSIFLYVPDRPEGNLAPRPIAS